MTTRRVLLSQAVLSMLTAQKAFADPVPSSLPPHPRLLMNAEGIGALKKRIAAAPWAKEQWQALQERIVATLNHPVDLPPRGGNWSHNYVCPQHGARLTRGKKIGPWEWEHTCPIGPHTLRGSTAKATLDFDGNAIAAVHSEHANRIVEAGLLYQVTGEAKYAGKAREVLLAYAERYLSYPLHDNQGKPGSGGRVASQSLTEASWIIPMAQGTDLIWQTLSEEDRRRVADQLLLPALNEIILKHPLGIHNIQCRHNSAIGLVGLLLGDQALISKAIDDPKIGYRQQLEKGVLADGMWLEGSSGYHFFTMEGLWPLAEAARNCGIDLYLPKFKSMFDAPFAFAEPDFILPDFNDSNEVSLRAQSPLYELGLARFHNPLYTSLLTTDAKGRRSQMALLFGVPELPKGNSTSLGSRNSPASGYAILQRGPGKDATWLCVKYGPHGGGHGHPDKNHVLIYTRGQVLVPDGGTHAYGSPLHGGWDKATVAHNTLTVDQTAQAPAQGNCIAFGNSKDVDYVLTDAGPIYKGVSFIRTSCLLTPELLVFVDQIQADAPRMLDLSYHQMGQWDALPTGSAWQAPTEAGYRFLREATQHKAGVEGLVLPTRVRDDWRSSFVLAQGSEPTEVITGYGIRQSTEDRVPMLLLRRTAQTTAFVWALSLSGAPITLRVAPVKDASGSELSLADAVLTEVTAGERRWSLIVNPHQKKLAVPHSDAPFTVV